MLCFLFLLRVTTNIQGPSLCRFHLIEKRHKSQLVCPSFVRAWTNEKALVYNQRDWKYFLGKNFETLNDLFTFLEGKTNSPATITTYQI